MPPLGPIKRRDLIAYLKRLGFEGPYVGGNHQYVKKGSTTIYIPNPHQGDIGKNLLIRILKQAGISKADWQKL